MPEETETAPAAAETLPVRADGAATVTVETPAPPSLVVEPIARPAAAGSRMRWLELALVLVFAFGQYILTSIFMLNGGNYDHQADSQYHFNSLLQEASSLLLLGYVLSRRKLRFKDIGLRWSIRDLGVGTAIVVVSYLAYYVGFVFIRLAAHSLSSSAAGRHTFHWGVLGYSMVPLLLLNPFFEELIVRAYLMTEVRQLTGSPVLAVIASVAVQTAYHLYYGWVGALSLALMFLVFSLYYATTKRITPVIIAHAILDLSALFR